MTVPSYTRPDYTVDAEGFTRAWALSVPGLVGPGGVLTGLHIGGDVRSPGRGAIAAVGLTGDVRDVDMEGLGDQARVSFLVKSIGRGNAGAIAECEGAARRLAGFCRTAEQGTLVTKPDGSQAVLAYVHTVYGPTPAEGGANVAYRVDATFVWQKVL